MRPLPFHSVLLAPTLPRPTGLLPALQHALDRPPATLEPVLDVLGLPYAYDVVLQDGFYLTLLALGVWWLQRARADE